MCADQQSAAAFSDHMASDWNETDTLHDTTIHQILDLADIRSGVHVLDVACGTGVLFPYYLSRNVASITGVDLSADMISQAKKKFQQSQIHLIRADILACRFDSPFDRCMVYHALSYFPDPAQLLRRLAICVKPGGRLTLAQCFGRTQEQCPPSLPDTAELARILAPWFLVDIQFSDGEKYVISGLRNDAPAVSAVPATDKR